MNEQLKIEPYFNSTFGPSYDEKLDGKRIATQMKNIFDLMKDGVWRSLNEISTKTNYSTASISAQLRHLRKKKFGGYEIQKQRSGNPENGLFVYRLLENTDNDTA